MRKRTTSRKVKVMTPSPLDLHAPRLERWHRPPCQKIPMYSREKPHVSPLPISVAGACLTSNSRHAHIGSFLLVDLRLFLGPGVNGRAEASAFLGFLNALLAALSNIIALAAGRFSGHAGKG